MVLPAVSVTSVGSNQFTICADATGYAAFGTGSTMKGSTMFVFEPKCGGKSGIYKSTGHSTPKFSSALSGSTVSADCTKSVSCAFTDSSGSLSAANSYIWAIGGTFFAQHSKYGSNLKIDAKNANTNSTYPKGTDATNASTGLSKPNTGSNSTITNSSSSKPKKGRKPGYRNPQRKGGNAKGQTKVGDKQTKGSVNSNAP